MPAAHAAKRAAKLAFGASSASIALACCTLSSVDDGLRVEVGIRAVPPETTSFTTDLGFRVTVTNGYVTIASVSIRPCDAAPEEAGLRSPSRLRAIGSSVAAFLSIREASAHTASSPTSLGVPGVLPLVPAAAMDETLGELLPPPDRYCATTVTLGPADADAVMLPDDAMVGLTLLVEGTWLAPDGGEPVPFRWESTATPSFEHATSFELAEGGTSNVSEALGAPLATIFDGIDLRTIDPAIGADRVAARVVSDLRIELR